MAPMRCVHSSWRPPCVKPWLGQPTCASDWAHAKLQLAREKKGVQQARQMAAEDELPAAVAELHQAAKAKKKNADAIAAANAATGSSAAARGTAGAAGAGAGAAAKSKTAGAGGGAAAVPVRVPNVAVSSRSHCAHRGACS